MKKNETTLLILAGIAVVGYFAFKKGGVLNQAPASQVSLNTLRQQTSLPQASLQQIPGVATELPSLPDIGIIAPALDPTGMQITLY